MVGCIQGCEAKAPIISVHACNLGFSALGGRAPPPAPSAGFVS